MSFTTELPTLKMKFAEWPDVTKYDLSNIDLSVFDYKPDLPPHISKVDEEKCLAFSNTVTCHLKALFASSLDSDGKLSVSIKDWNGMMRTEVEWVMNLYNPLMRVELSSSPYVSTREILEWPNLTEVLSSFLSASDSPDSRRRGQSTDNVGRTKQTCVRSASWKSSEGGSFAKE